MSKKVKGALWTRIAMLSPYNMDMLIFVTNEGLREAKERFNITFDECWYHEAGIGGGVHHIEETSTIAVVLHIGDIEVFAHEAYHVLNLVYKHTGMAHDLVNDEAGAYMLGYIANEMADAWVKCMTKKVEK